MSKKILNGEVLTKISETVVKVEVEKLVRHPIYLKSRKVHKRYLVFTELPVKIGDRVLIEEIRPLSKRIRFRVQKVKKAGEQ